MRDLADREPPTAPPLAALLFASTAALRARMSRRLSRRGACFDVLHSSCGDGRRLVVCGLCTWEWVRAQAFHDASQVTRRPTLLLSRNAARRKKGAKFDRWVTKIDATNGIAPENEHATALNHRTDIKVKKKITPCQESFFFYLSVSRSENVCT